MLKNDRGLLFDFDHNRETALHWAAKLGHSKIAQLLIKSGANINSQDQLLRTPIYSAAKKNQYQTVLELLKAGVNLDI